MILSIEEAKLNLRVDNNDLDTEIEVLINSIPAYLQVATGKRWDDEETVRPIARTVSIYLLRLWFDGHILEASAPRIQSIINNLMQTLKLIANESELQTQEDGGNADA